MEDFIDITKLMNQLTTHLDVMENSATKFARYDKIEKQLVKAGLTAQPNLCLALAMSAFKSTGEYDTQIHEFKAKSVADKAFANFRPFIINKYAKCTKQHKSTTKSVRFGIAKTLPFQWLL